MESLTDRPPVAAPVTRRARRSLVAELCRFSFRLLLAIGPLALAGCESGVDGSPTQAPSTAPGTAPGTAPRAAASTVPSTAQAPGQPTGIRVVDAGVDFLVWAWDPVESATSYEGHAFPDGTPPSERPPLRETMNPTLRADGLEPGTTMGIFVRAIRETAGGRAAGPWSYGSGTTLAPPSPAMTVTGTVRATDGPVALVAGVLVRARNLGTGAVDGETTTDANGSYAISELTSDRYSIEVTAPSGYLSEAVLVSRPKNGDLEVSADISLLYYTLPEGAATPLPAGRLIYKPANFFDLEGKALAFTPDGDGYQVTVDDLNWDPPGPAALSHRLIGTDHQFVAVELPFSFHFSGRDWRRVYANANGHLSFLRPEQENWSARDPWAGGTMRSLAAAIDSRSAGGLEAQIAALWAIYGDMTLSVESTPARVVFTWSATRPMPAYRYNAPLGLNLFQARLYPSGEIKLAYRTVAERDGLVGLFQAQSGRGPVLDKPGEAAGDVDEPAVDITDLELVDAGSTLLFRMTLAQDVPARVEDGEIEYRIFFGFGEYDCSAALEVNATGRESTIWCGPNPNGSGFGHRVDGAIIEFFVSRTLLHGADRVEWDADAIWWGRKDDNRISDQILEVGSARVDRTDLDLDTTGRRVDGSAFEVFHYPVFPKLFSHVTSYIYEQVPANDEIAVLFTDFRIDDLFGHGPSTGAINARVQGIGRDPANPWSGERFGSENLLVSMAPQFLGAENLWRESGLADNGHPFRNFAEGIWWIAHETTHRWIAFMRFRNPLTGRIESLRDDHAHWSDFLHSPAMYPVWPGFSSGAYVEASVNSGGVWTDNGNGTFTRRDDGTALARGLSALDLYAMGMIPPEDVPDTFILRPREGTGAHGTVRATRVPVRIEDVIAAEGRRLPAAADSRKEFRLGVYVLHDRATPRPDLLRRARGISAAVAEYFFRATGGRMMVLPSPSSTR